ncbi:CHC2 zinc finger domain-containing protein [Hallerella succinigenes]|uniref:CHC2-type zinc finger protein n=1 Tax=Hallerella succinigenes TaxID=1896222 RepID=A0A2M9A957_9BACT|nr:CHC2 zinc finger domain-containing protein [Hallerella succinigenes]PJJ42218.1 CHC2-type zinc finger protein [Hallerella succinigenes]
MLIEEDKIGLSRIKTHPKRLGIPLRRWGRNLISQCPFHAPEESSLFFYDSLGYWRYRCLQCGNDGDLVEFLMRSRFNGLDEKTARKEALDFWGASEADLKSEEENLHEKEIGGAKARVLECFVRYCHWAASKSESTAEFLKARGWDLAQAQIYGLGYYSGDPEPFYSYCLLSGLERHEVSFYLDNLDISHEPRLTIPARNSKGIVHSVYGRLLDNAGTPNSGEEPYISYASGPLDIPFNIQQDIDNPIVVEGFFDALTADLAGIPGVVSTMYQPFSRSHLYKLKSCGAEGITLVLRKETNRRNQELHVRKCLELAESEALKFKSIILPAGETVDTIVRAEGGDFLLNMIRNTEEDTMRTHRKSVLLQDIRENFNTAMSRDADSDVGFQLSNFPALTHALDGIQPGYYFLSSDPFGFKSYALSSFALDLVEGNPDAKVIYVALDSPRRQAFDRLVAMIAGVSEADVRKQNKDDSINEKIHAATQELIGFVKSDRLEIWEDTDTFKFNLLLKELQTELSEKQKLILIIDGMDHLRISDRGDIPDLNERRSSAAIDLYKELDIPVFISGSVTKDGDKLIGPRPYLRDADATFWIERKEDGALWLTVNLKNSGSTLYEANLLFSDKSYRMKEKEP